MSKRIPLTQGKFALVDDVDYDWLNQWKWYYVSDRHTGYAVRSQWDKATKSRTRVQMALAIMHRLSSQCPEEVLVDHANGDGLDNRRHNLRICTRSQNAANKRKSPGCSSIYKGVHWHKRNHKWYAHIKFHGKDHHLGSFDNEQDAATAYDIAAPEAFGEFAQLNLTKKGDYNDANM